MAKIIWTDNAITDLHEIGDYIALNSLHFATKTVEYLFESVNILLIYPNSEKVVIDFENDSIRELVRGNYRIVYKIISNQQINILFVHHGARFMNEDVLER